jgi:hypothetical protein
LSTARLFRELEKERERERKREKEREHQPHTAIMAGDWLSLKRKRPQRLLTCSTKSKNIPAKQHGCVNNLELQVKRRQNMPREMQRS